MWARIATFEGGDDERLEEINRKRMARADMPMPAGMLGGMVMKERSGGRRLFIAYFDSAESIDAAADHFEQMGAEIPEDIRGRRTSVDAYEVVFNSWEQ